MDVQTQNMGVREVKQEPPPSPSGGEAAISPSPSATSSPSHEFSFTISLNPQITDYSKNLSAPVLSASLDKTKQSQNQSQTQSPFAIDLSPADEIFFHGHLLPLHLLSHLPVSPRSSTNSTDGSLPILDEQKLKNSKKIDHDNSYYDLNHSFHNHHETNSFNIPKEKPKSKSFSLFKWRKGEKEDKEKQGKLKFDLNQVLKRYMRMMRPLLTFRSKKNMQFHRQSYSFSGNLSFRGKKEIRGIKRGAYSAPVSMKNSPTNSGVLVATPGVYTSSSSSDSTMEELQAAIQAAIAHCKKSSTMDDKIKCQESTMDEKIKCQESY